MKIRFSDFLLAVLALSLSTGCTAKTPSDSANSGTAQPTANSTPSASSTEQPAAESNPSANPSTEQPVAESAPSVNSGTKQQAVKSNRLNLTKEQREKIKQIKQSSQAQIQAVLTPSQQAQMKTALENKQKQRQVMSSLNLTKEQKDKIRQIKQASEQQINALLTPEQQQIQNQRQQKHSQHQSQ